VEVALQRLHPRAIVPARMSEGASGHDLCACFDEGATLAIPPGARALVPTGWALAMPSGIEAQVRPRSGLALRHGITVLNAPGTIDSDYRGEVRVLLVNLGDAVFTVGHGDRIAQLVIASVAVPVWTVVAELSETPRGAGGFGSTGPSQA